MVSIPWPGSEPILTHLNMRQPSSLLRLGVMMTSGVLTTVRVLRRRRIEHTLAMWAVPSGVWALAGRKLLGIPYSVWALGSDIWRISDYPLGRTLLRHVLRNADRLYADGVGLAGDVAKIAGRPCAFLATSRRLPAPDPDRIPNLDPKRTHFLCVARFHEHKGVDVLIRAVALIPEELRPSMEFHVFGAGPGESRLRELVRVKGLSKIVQIREPIGPVELSGYLQSVRALIIPSRIESIPLILSDAAQAGCPVIATDVGDVGDLVRNHRMGESVAPSNPDALAEAICRSADRPREEPAGAKTLAEQLSLAASAQRFLEDVRR